MALTLPAFLDTATGRARCIDVLATEADYWFSSEATDRRRAKEICRSCPLLAACGQHALDANERGVWGALSSFDRAEIRKGHVTRGGKPLPLAGVRDDDGKLICGSEAAYRGHIARHERLIDDECTAAHARHIEEQRREQLLVEHAAGGSVRGYDTHRRLGEDACDRCRAAMAAKSAQERAARAARKASTARSRLAADPEPTAQAIDAHAPAQAAA